jgi:hypothetical protein
LLANSVRVGIVTASLVAGVVSVVGCLALAAIASLLNGLLLTVLG